MEKIQPLLKEIIEREITFSSENAKSVQELHDKRKDEEEEIKEQREKKKKQNQKKASRMIGIIENKEKREQEEFETL